MEKDGAGAKPKEEAKEGFLLLGVPKFSNLGNGRLKCKVTGHELPVKEKESYVKSKACRLALIDAAVAKKKAPLNLFEQCSDSKSKLVCQLTGDIINKSEEHIWKHINGKRFLNKLEEKELEDVAPLKAEVKKIKEPKKIKRQPEATECKQAVKVNDNASENHGQNIDNSEEELEFWIPPVGERWDADDGKDRWEDDDDSEQELCNDVESADKLEDPESNEFSSGKKRKCRSSSMKRRRKKRKAMKKALKANSK